MQFRIADRRSLDPSLAPLALGALAGILFGGGGVAAHNLLGARGFLGICFLISLALRRKSWRSDDFHFVRQRENSLVSDKTLAFCRTRIAQVDLRQALGPRRSAQKGSWFCLILCAGADSAGCGVWRRTNATRARL